MTGLLRRGSGVSLEDRLRALGEALELARGRLPTEDIEAGKAVLGRASRRLGLGLEATVVALCGATGSGKSSLFNALAGRELSPVGVLRPTTGQTRACVWGPQAFPELLDWLRAAHVHRIESGDRRLDGLVLLDLPDNDSVATEHRLEVDRLVQIVDLLVWITDPQKYADAVLHDAYLSRFFEHREVTVVVLNHIDTLSTQECRRCVADLKRLLERDELKGVPVITTSAVTGHGIDDLRGLVVESLDRRSAALDRLAADVRLAAHRLARYCPSDRSPNRPERSTRKELMDAFSAAANVETVSKSVGRSHSRSGIGRAGWPLTRWTRKLRPEPLARLHLSGTGEDGGATSLPAPTPIQRVRIGGALRAAARHVAGDLPDPWPGVFRSVATAEEESLPATLDRTVASTDLGAGTKPRWWTVAGGLQWLLLAAAIGGALWLFLLAVLRWLQLPRPAVPHWEGIALPTVLLLGGLLCGFFLAQLFRLFIRVGAARVERLARRRLSGRLEKLVDAEVLEPLERERESYVALCRALERCRAR